MRGQLSHVVACHLYGPGSPNDMEVQRHVEDTGHTYIGRPYSGSLDALDFQRFSKFSSSLTQDVSNRRFAGLLAHLHAIPSMASTGTWQDLGVTVQKRGDPQETGR